MGKKSRIKEEHKTREAQFRCLMKPQETAIPFAVIASAKGKCETSAAFKGFQKEVSRELAVENEKFYQREIAAVVYAVWQYFKVSRNDLIGFVNAYRGICTMLTDFYKEDYSKESCVWVFQEILKRELGIDVTAKYTNQMLLPRTDGRDERGRFVKRCVE